MFQANKEHLGCCCMDHSVTVICCEYKCVLLAFFCIFTGAPGWGQEHHYLHLVFLFMNMFSIVRLLISLVFMDFFYSIC